MPFLRLETATPSETDKIIQSQAEEIEKLKKQLGKLSEFQKIIGVIQERLDMIERDIKYKQET
jgi:hypothetical protein